MIDENFAILREVVPADVLRISLADAAIERLPHLLILIRYDYLHVAPDELERIEQAYLAKCWRWDDDQVIEVTVTDTFDRAPFETAVRGYLNGPLVHRRPREESATGLQRKKSGAQRRQNVTERVDLEKVHDILEFGFTREELADAVGVSTKTVGSWCRRWKASYNQIFSRAAGLTAALTTLHETLIQLNRSGLANESIAAWWRSRQPELDNLRPAELFQRGVGGRILVQEAAAQVRTEGCTV